MAQNKKVLLRGITWNHTRGYLPMVATAQRFSETNPDVEIVWEKRSLQEFADLSIEQLARRFDLLVIDHPFVGYAEKHRVLLPLEEHLEPEFLADQAANSVGASHASYDYGGHQWALAIDAAAPVSAWRQDILTRTAMSIPEDWEEVIEFARRGMVAIAAKPVDCLMNFFMLCSSLGEDPFSREECVLDREICCEALIRLRDLTSLCPPEVFDWNPIAVYEVMAHGSSIAFCPFAYGYSNYARSGYAPTPLAFGELCAIGKLPHARSTLGGAGLAISVHCKERSIAVAYVRFVASPECQKTLYVQSGGQPGHRSAWLDDDANRLTNGYFRKTLSVLDRAYVRPRYDGYIEFQDQAGLIVHEFLRSGGDVTAVWRRLDQVRRETQPRQFAKED